MVLSADSPPAEYRSASAGRFVMRTSERFIAGAQFQVVIRLQAIRRLVSEWRQDRDLYSIGNDSPTQELIWVIQGTAAAARTAGLVGLASVCWHVCERVTRVPEPGAMPSRLRGLLLNWSAYSELYVRRPWHAQFAMAVVEQLNNRSWGAPLHEIERAELLSAMQGAFSPDTAQLTPK